MDCVGQLYDDEIVIFTAQTFEIQDDPDWSGPAIDPTRILTLGFTAMNGDNYNWDVGSGSHVVIPPVPDSVTPTLVEQRSGSEQANFYVWASSGKLYVNIDPVTSSFEVDVIEGYYGFTVTQDGTQRWVVLYDCIGQLYDDDFFVFTAQTFEIKDDPDWSGPILDPTRILTLGFMPVSGDNYSWDVTPITTVPTITTKSVSSIASNTASCGGNVTSDGGADISSRGVCWSTSASPTTSGDKTSDGTGTGEFTSSLTYSAMIN